MQKTVVGILTAVSLALASASAFSQGYPVRPIRLIIGFAPGNILDGVTRLAIPEMSKRLGQQVIVEFKLGAGSTIAAKYVLAAAPDGYTLWYGNAMTIHPLFMPQNGVDAGKEFASVAQFVTVPFAIAARTTLPANSMQQLVAYAKAKPNSLRFGSSNALSDLMMALLENRTGVAAEGIRYKGTSEAVTAVLAGDVDFSAGSVTTYVSFAQSRRLNVLFLAAAKRSPALPDVPTAAEWGIANLELAGNTGAWAPPQTPRDIILKVNAAAAAALKAPEMAAQIRKLFSAEVVASTPEDQTRAFEAEAKIWLEAARISNYKPAAD